MTFEVASCSPDAARYAVENWHYTARLPLNGKTKLVRCGLWEDGVFSGAVVFSAGAAASLASPYRLDRQEVCELARVALRDGHSTPTTAVVARSLRILTETSPDLRLVVSFADPAAGHVGRIYQAGNWLYLGQTAGGFEILFEGRWQHSRNLTTPGFGYGGRPGRVSKLTAEARGRLPRRELPGKHRYVYPLDRAIRRRLAPLVRPYPSSP